MVLLDMKMPISCKDCDLRDSCDNCSVTWENVADEVDDEVIADSCPIKAEIPKNATNGDVIEALFSWIKSEKDYENSMVAILMSGHKGYIHFDLEWWNAPWKGQEE